MWAKNDDKLFFAIFQKKRWEKEMESVKKYVSHIKDNTKIQWEILFQEIYISVCIFSALYVEIYFYKVKWKISTEMKRI